jgi:hypothetical protein
MPLRQAATLIVKVPHCAVPQVAQFPTSRHSVGSKKRYDLVDTAQLVDLQPIWSRIPAAVFQLRRAIKAAAARVTLQNAA